MTPFLPRIGARLRHKKYIAVVDETGSNRPQEQGPTFGVAALLFPSDAQAKVVKASREIGEIVGKKDYKYKHVQRSDLARARFLQLFNGSMGQMRCYGFFTAAAGVMGAEKRNDDASAAYASHWLPDAEEARTGTPVNEQLLRSFVKYMAGHLIAHAVTKDYALDVYWDQRSDLDVVKLAWEESEATTASFARYSRAPRLVSLVGQASGELNAIARLSGVVAGDLQSFFNKHGNRIWPHLDATGMRGVDDPIRICMERNEGPPCVFTCTDRLADADPGNAVDGTTMLQGYYKAFLDSSPEGHRLISFASPSGQYGILRIERGDRWHIHQLPD